MLLLNIPDGSVVKLLLLRYLLKSETKALDVIWHVQTTLSTTHKEYNAVLVLNRPDGSVVNGLPITPLLVPKKSMRNVR